MKKTIGIYLLFIAIAVVFFVVIKTTLNPVIVTGSSMYPTYKSGQFVSGKKIDKELAKGDIVVVKTSNKKIIKRVVGTPGDNLVIKDGKLFVNDEEQLLYDEPISDAGLLCDLLTLKDNEYFVMGDNVNFSEDSRVIGAVDKNDIICLIKN